MKSYTNIEQSKKLSRILLLKSADMHYARINYYDEIRDWNIYLSPIPEICVSYIENLPCWSLAALLNVLPKYEIYNNGEIIQLDVNLNALATEGDETLLDLVVNMIIHLHEL